jgi:hypothetical protein
MPHEFTRPEEELEPQAAGGRLGGPPRKHTSACVLDPPVPPRKPLSPIPAIPRSALIRLFVVVILAALAMMALMLFWKSL